MSKHKWFFKRGNARLSWETLPDWTQVVVVTKAGNVWACEDKPALTTDGWLIDDGSESYNIIVAYVGHFCPDWRSLIFERLQPESALDAVVKFVDNGTFAKALAELGLFSAMHDPCKCILPIITTDEWKAIRITIPGAQWLAKDDDGHVYAYTKSPKLCPGAVWGGVVSPDWQPMPFLEDRFASVPWNESLVKYEPPQENFSIRVTCACGEEVLVDNEPVYGISEKRNYSIPCPKCHANLKVKVRYES